MPKYPMLQGVDEERVFKIGGKAAILEEIIKKWPGANVPPFEIVGEGMLSRWGDVARIFRTSSELDIFGGCGLFDTYRGVTRRDFSKVIQKMKEQEGGEYGGQNPKILAFAESVGRKLKNLAIISQLEGNPEYWATVMQHPNNPDVHLVNYSTRHSPECKEPLFDGQCLSGIGGNTYTAICIDGIAIQGELESDGHDNLVEMVSFHHTLVDVLEIVSDEWVSILEAGICLDPAGHFSTQTYQFTPIRKKLGFKCDIPEDKLIFGACDEMKLPVVNIPARINVSTYIAERNEYDCPLKDYPQFREFVKADKHVDRYSGGGPIGDYDTANMLADMVFLSYIKFIEQKYPQGYMILFKSTKDQSFDVGVTNAKAVLLNTGRNPLELLNHNLSRLICKAPVLVVGPVKKEIPTGEMATFSCDGSGYSII